MSEQLYNAKGLSSEGGQEDEMRESQTILAPDTVRRVTPRRFFVS
jgi:hypothetical protein